MEYYRGGMGGSCCEGRGMISKSERANRVIRTDRTRSEVKVKQEECEQDWSEKKVDEGE